MLTSTEGNWGDIGLFRCTLDDETRIQAKLYIFNIESCLLCRRQTGHRGNVRFSLFIYLGEPSEVPLSHLERNSVQWHSIVGVTVGLNGRV